MPSAEAWKGIIDGPPPTRHDPGACADRTSPNASQLFQAVTALSRLIQGPFLSASPWVW